MKLTKRGAVWRVEFTGADGARKRITTGKRDRAEAEKVAAQLVADFHRGAVAATAGARKVGPGDRTLVELTAHVYLHRWNHSKSEKHFRGKVRVVDADLGHLLLREVTYARVTEWIELLRSRGHKPATISRYLSIVSTCFQEAYRLGWVEGVPRLPTVKVDNIRERYLTNDEEKRLLTAFDGLAMTPRNGTAYAYMRDLCVVLLDTGMRVGEALALKDDNIQGDAVFLRHGETKTGKGRTIPLTPRAKEAVGRLRASEHWGNFKHAQADHTFKVAKKYAKLPDVVIHTLRHTCASRLVQAGVDLYRVGRWLGHSQIKTTLRYAHLRPEDMHSVRDVLATRGKD